MNVKVRVPSRTFHEIFAVSAQGQRKVSIMASYVSVKRQVACPFSIAASYAADFLRRFEVGPLAGVVEVPIPILGHGRHVMLKHHVRLRVAVHEDPSDTVRRHEALRISWWSESRWLPSLSGTLRFRLASYAETQLLFDGTYTPPFGLVGMIFDKLIGNRVAAATGNELLSRLGSALESKERAFRAMHAGER